MVQNARGTRDYLPAEQILRQEIIATLRYCFELHGFSPLDTPALERFETLSAKYAGGEEILKETFKLTDQGERDLGLRYDLTVPLARVIASHPELKMPFKRYQVDKVWRDGPVQKGRYREFIQCDADVIGSSSPYTDAELLGLIDTCFTKLGLKVLIKVNDIRVLDGILAHAGIKAEQRGTVILTLDKLEKVGQEGVRKELLEKGIDEAMVERLFVMLAASGTNDQKLKHLHDAIPGAEEKHGLVAIQSVLELCGHFTNKISFEPSLARGLSYYTGTIVETFLIDADITSSVCSGGRYDKLIGAMVESDRHYPAIGISFGVDRIFDALVATRSRQSVTKALIVHINVPVEASRIGEKLRAAGINTEVYFEKGMSKALDYANALKIPFCLIVGARELAEGKVKLKDMLSGEERLETIEHAIALISKGA